MDGTYTILMLVVMFAIIYFMMIRPENKRKKAAEQMRNSLKKGDKLTTIGGIVGTVVAVTGNTLVIETSDDRVRMEITKWAVSNTGVQTSVTPDKKKKEPEQVEEASKEPAEESQPAEEEKKD